MIDDIQNIAEILFSVLSHYTICNNIIVRCFEHNRRINHKIPNNSSYIPPNKLRYFLKNI